MTKTSRRDAGRPRGKPIEDAILTAALDDLATHGVAGLSVDRIAEAAEVNKTTVYRRYGSTTDLAAAALQRAMETTAAALRDHGDLRSDLYALVTQTVDQIGSAGGKALIRAGMSEEVAAAVADIPPGSQRDPDEVGELVRRAVDRGEWDPSMPPDAAVGMLVGGVVHRLMLERRPADETWVTAVVEIFARGVAPPRATS